MSKKAESWVWDHSETSGNDRLVLLFLADQGDDDGLNSFPSIERVASKCRVDKDTVRRVINRLEDAGEILVERPERQGRGWYNRYTLVLGREIGEVEALAAKARDLRPFANRTPRAPRRHEKVAEGGERVAQLGVIPIDPYTSFVSTQDARAHAEAILFPEWYAAYPRHEARPAALRAYLKAARKATPRQLLDSAIRYRDDPNRLDEFTKHPATWLNNECWNDPPLPTRIRRVVGGRDDGLSEALDEWGPQ